MIKILHLTQFHTLYLKNLSVSYGVEEIESGTAADQDAEYSKISASYTTGGVTLSASFQKLKILTMEQLQSKTKITTS
jgi:hypothetical protein